jgi:uncharacterized membrane protein
MRIKLLSHLITAAVAFGASAYALSAVRGQGGSKRAPAVGTLGGRAIRAKLAATLGSDRPAAFTEDAVAVGGALLIGVALR